MKIDDLFLLFFSENRFDISCILSIGDNLHGMSKPVFPEETVKTNQIDRRMVLIIKHLNTYLYSRNARSNEQIKKFVYNLQTFENPPNNMNLIYPCSH